MLSNEFYAELDKLWTEFWPATDIKPLAVIDFINSIFFVRQLEELQEKKERSAAFYGKAVESPIFTSDQQELRWSAFQNLDKQSLYLLFNRKDSGVLDFARQTSEYKKWPKFDTENKALVPTPDLLKSTIQLIGSLDVVDSTARTEINNFLLNKVQAASQVPENNLSDLEIKKQPLKKTRFQLSALNVSVILLLLFVAGFAIASFYFSARNNKIAATKKDIPVAGNDTLVVPATETTAAKKEIVSKTLKKTRKQEGIQKSSVKNKPKAAPTPKNKAIAIHKDTATGEIKGKYKIISKAYFHNEPDESTRRNAFVVHWNNSYATLKALDEKNGFVYVVFHNHLNQTSKGWLRKKDLRPVE